MALRVEVAFRGWWDRSTEGSGTSDDFKEVPYQPGVSVSSFFYVRE